MISGLNKQLQQELKYTLLKLDCHSWWISKRQCGREDTLEERYEIKFCFKLGKNATETYGILQTAFRPSCMNQASVFERHKRFKEGRESVRDAERCGRSKEVSTPELIGQRVRAFFLSSESVVMRELRRWKRLCRRSLTRSHKRTSMGPSRVVGTVQQVHCSRRRLLRMGLDFHVCTMNKSAHTKKVWKLI